MATKIEHRSPVLLHWAPRGDLLNNKAVLRNSLCCHEPLAPGDYALLFLGRVPGGALVITQEAVRKEAFTEAGTFPLGNDEGTSVGTTLRPPPSAQGLSAVLQVTKGTGVAPLFKPNPWLFLLAGPRVDGVEIAFAPYGKQPDPTSWKPEVLRHGWAVVALPPGTNGEQVRVRWMRAGQVVEEGMTDTPYAM